MDKKTQKNTPDVNKAISQFFTAVDHALEATQKVQEAKVTLERLVGGFEMSNQGGEDKPQ
jgi:hypothetical protein